MKVQPFLELDRVLDYQSPRTKGSNDWGIYGVFDVWTCGLLALSVCAIASGFVFDRPFENIFILLGGVIFHVGLRRWMGERPRW